MNTDQAKHLANSARIIGMAQFAFFAARYLDDWRAVTDNVVVVAGCAALYVWSERIAYKSLGRVSNG